MKQKRIQTNRFLAMLLTVVMLLSMLPVSAFAADLPVTSTTGTWKDIAVGVELFTDKSNCTVKTLPEELAGMKYLHDCMYTANVATATGDVYIYVLTPSLEMPDYSQQTALEAEGFTAVKTYPVAAITSDLGEPLVLMEKKFSDGDSVTLPMWGIILASETKLGGESEPAGFTLKDLASVDVTGGSLEKVASGGKLFADRENHLFGDAIPAWLDGTSYLCANLAAVSATVTKAGWVYVLTPVTGAPDTQQAALEAAGYEKVETIPMANFSSGTIENDMAVMAKEVKAGDVISYAAWGILLAEATVEVPAVAPTSGSMKTLALNELVFSDKPYKFTTVPEYLSGVSYVCAPISGTGATFNVDGYAYVLTPVPAEGNAGLYSQQAKLESEGYKLIKTYEVGALSTDLGESLAMMGKKVAAGDSVSVPMWGIILFSETKLNVADAVGDPDDGGNSGEDPDDGDQGEEFQFGELAKVEGAGASVITSGALMFTDRQHAFHPQLPDYLEGLDYVKGPLDGGTRTVTVTEAGWVYFLTPTTGIDTQQAALEEAGYETLYVIPAGVIGTTIGEAMAVMGKECAVGEVAHAGQWAIMIAKGDPEFDPNVISLKAPLVQINPTTETESYQDGQRTWQGIPSIARDDESGRLWATWYGGDADFPGEGRTNFVMLYTSDDDGATWTGPKVVIDPHYTARSSDMRAFDPNLWVDPDGKMWFIWNQSNGHFDGRGGVWAIYTENPGAEDPTWSEPKRLANGIIMCDPTVLTKASGDLPAGAWVMPTAIWDGPSTGAADIMNDPNYADERYSNCYVSLDKGETWTLQGSVLEYDMVRDCDENMIIQQPDGSLRMWIRAKGGIAESTSTDGGKTWTKAVNAGVSPVVSRFWVGWLDEETQLAVFNDPPSGGNSRSHMTAALSFDGGNTWSEKFVVEEGGGCSYPDVHIGEDGFIYITYDAGRFNPMARVFMCKITKEDIIAGELVNENSKLSVLINNNSVCEVTDITLNETKYTLNVKNEETLQLTAEVTFSNNTNVDKSVVWASSDESVATVDQNGLVTAVSDGVAAISVTANNNGLSKECVLTINGYAAKEVEEAKAAAEAAKKEAEEAKAAAEAAKKEAEEAKAKLEAAEKAAEENKAKLEAAEKAAAEAKAKQEAAEKAAEEAKVKQEAAEKALEELLKGENPKPEDPKPEEPKPIENPFVDIEEDMFCYDAVLWAYENEITTGKDATHFNPSGNCTRSQVVTFLWRAAGKPAPKSSENPFPDVATGKFYTEAVAWAVENGITAGFKDGTFGPDKTCTRDQIVTFLWRFAGEPEPKSTENTFPDVKADAFYTDAVLWAVENGITTGYKDGTFGPSKTCKRDQIVTFLYRYMAE